MDLDRLESLVQYELHSNVRVSLETRLVHERLECDLSVRVHAQMIIFLAVDIDRWLSA